MADLIEAIARGIFNASRRAIGGQVTWNDEWPDQTTKDEARACARAALLAIEQSGTHVVASIMPTPDMVEAGMEAMVRDLGDSANAPPSYIVWRAMLSARPKVTET